MLRRRTMPVSGWGVASATRLTVADHRVKAIKSNKWFPDVLKGATAAVGGDAILSRADINWEDKKGTSVLRLLFGLDASCAVTVIYVHRKMAGKLLTLACRYMGSPEFLPVVRHVVAAKYLVTLDVAMTAAEVGDLNERRLWLATAVALGDEGRLLPQFPMYARPPAGFPPEVVKGLSAIAASSRNPKAVALVKQLLALTPGQKMPDFDVAFSWVFEGERLEQWIQMCKPKTAKGRAALKRRAATVAANYERELKPKTPAAAKRLKDGMALAQEKFSEMAGGRGEQTEMPERGSGEYGILCQQKCKSAYYVVGMHLFAAKKPVRFTAQWERGGGEITFECQGVVNEAPPGARGSRKNDYFVQCFDVAKPSDFYWWWTFPVADFLGLAEPLVPRQTEEFQQEKRRAVAADDADILEVV